MQAAEIQLTVVPELVVIVDDEALVRVVVGVETGSGKLKLISEYFLIVKESDLADGQS